MKPIEMAYWYLSRTLRPGMTYAMTVAENGNVTVAVDGLIPATFVKDQPMFQVVA